MFFSGQARSQHLCFQVHPESSIAKMRYAPCRTTPGMILSNDRLPPNRMQGSSGSRRINSAWFFPSEGLRAKRFWSVLFSEEFVFFTVLFLVWMISLLCFFRLPLLRNKHKFHGRSAASTSEGFQASLNALEIYSSRNPKKFQQTILWKRAVQTSRKLDCKNRLQFGHVALLKRIAAVTRGVVATQRFV